MPDSSAQQVSFWKGGSFDTYYDLAITPTPSLYILWDSSFLSKEASDEDVLRYAAQSPAFAFLNDPEEDIYTTKDGKAICH